MTFESAVIRRGRMAADRFTQISNAVCRDARLSYRARGVFAALSSHRDGMETSITALAAGGKEGRDAVRTALKELENLGYLVRRRERTSEGKLGQMAYYITDDPAEGPDAQVATTDGFPGDGAPTAGNQDPGIQRSSVGEPASENPPLKNTNKEENTKNTGAAPPAAEAPEPITRRANAVSRAYCDTHPLDTFHAVRDAVTRALRAGYDEARITDAMAAIDPRPITARTLQVELAGGFGGGRRTGYTQAELDELFREPE